MSESQYALVAYVRSAAAGVFVESLRREVHPVHAHLPAHVTVLPPRPLRGPESDAISHLAQLCEQIAPFEICFGEVHSFMPTTPTIFLQIARAAYKLRELHDLLDSDGLQYSEPLPYMPHMTIAKLDSLEHAREVYEISRERWAGFGSSRCATIESLSFVRGRGHEWTDLATLSLGSRSVVSLP